MTNIAKQSANQAARRGIPPPVARSCGALPAGRARNDRRRPRGYYVVAGIDMRAEMLRLCRLDTFGGVGGRLAKRPPRLAIRRASGRPRSRLGFAVPAEWRLSVTDYPGIRRGDAQETLLHELVHLHIGPPRGSRRWHGHEFKETLRAAMREAYGVVGVPSTGAYHGAYADELERIRTARVHPQQLDLGLREAA
jgi:hypothetical protein